jgi:hypothetical protein
MNGKVVIKFNQKMNTSLNTSWINQTNTLIYVEPQDKRDLEIGFNKSSLDITWFVDSYQDDVMKINIKFSNP